MANPQKLYLLKDKAKVYLKQNRWFDAKQTLMKMLKIESSNDAILTKIAEVNEKLTQFDDAHDYYQQAIQINPQNKKALKQLGMLYHYQFDDLSKAEQYYIQYNTIHPHNDFIHLNLAKIYIKQHKYSQAADVLKSCDFTKAAINYHFGVCLLAIGQSVDALRSFACARDIKPKVVKYHFEHGKLCVKLGKTQLAKQSFLEANKLTQSKDPEILFANSLCSKYFPLNHSNNSLWYIDLALELKPNHIPYKYFRLKCLHKYDISVPVAKDDSLSYDNLINKKIDLLVCGYTRNNLHVYIPSDILPLIHSFFYDYNQTLSAKYSYYIPQFDKQEIISMLFDALCPGKDETKLIFIITKLCDAINVDRCHIHYSMLILELICKFSNVYNALSIIEQTEDYVNYKVQLIKSCHDQPLLLFQLFNDNDNFFTIYKSLLSWCIAVPLLIDEECFIYPNLKYTRFMLMKFRIGIDEENNQLTDIDSITAIKTLSAHINKRNGSWNNANLLMLLAGEIKCLNKKDLNNDYELAIALDKILYSMWGYIGLLLTFKEAQIKSLLSIFEMFQSMSLNLKPSEMDWGNFFGQVSEMISIVTNIKDKQSPYRNIYEIVKEYCNKIEMDINNEFYEEWTRCILLFRNDACNFQYD